MTATTAADVAAAMGRIRDHVRRTPVLALDAADDAVVLKLECLQHSGSFKVRGGFNSALAQGVPEAGLIAASGGNHGVAVAHVAHALGVRAEIYVPRVATPVKVDRIRRLGAEVHVVGDDYADAQSACDARIAESGALAIHPYDAPLTVAGQGTVGLEIADQVPDVTSVVVAVGGGGLAAGVALALPHVRVVAVETEQTAGLHASIAAGRRTEVDVGGVAADSLGARRIGAIPWEVLRDRVESVVVTDADVMAARQDLWDRAQLVTEPGGAAAHAALLGGAWRPGAGERTVVVACGANTDPGDLVARD